MGLGRPAVRPLAARGTSRGRQVRQHDDRELQALGLVHASSAARAGQDGQVDLLAGAELLGGVEVGQEGAEPGATVDVAEPVDELQQAGQADVADAVGRRSARSASICAPGDGEDRADQVGQRARRPATCSRRSSPRNSPSRPAASAVTPPNPGSPAASSRLGRSTGSELAGRRAAARRRRSRPAAGRRAPLGRPRAAPLGRRAAPGPPGRSATAGPASRATSEVLSAGSARTRRVDRAPRRVRAGLQGGRPRDRWRGSPALRAAAAAARAVVGAPQDRRCPRAGSPRRRGRPPGRRSRRARRRPWAAAPPGRRPPGARGAAARRTCGCWAAAPAAIRLAASRIGVPERRFTDRTRMGPARRAPKCGPNASMLATEALRQP